MTLDKNNSYLLSSLENNRFFFTIVFLSILISFISLAVLYSLYAPTFEGPDEQFHYKFVKDIHSNSLSKEDYVKEGPLYYTISAFFLNFVDHPKDIEIEVNSFYPHDANKFLHSYEEQFPFYGTAKAVHILRLFSILGGAITLIYTYKTAMLVFSKNRTLSLFSMGFVALIPKFVWMSSVMNPDSLVYAFSTISIFFLIKFVNDLSKIKPLIFFSVFAGLSLLTKANSSILFVIIFVTFVYLVLSKKITKKFFLNRLGLVGVISILSGAWFSFQRILLTINLNNLHFSSIFSLLTSTTDTQSKPVDYVIGATHLTNTSLIHQRMFEMLWGWLGWHVIRTSDFFLIVGDIMIVLSSMGLILILIKKSWNDFKISPVHLVVLLTGTIFMTSAMYSYLYLGGSGDIRYTFPVISLFTILFSLGMYRLVKSQKILLIVPIIILFSMNAYLLGTMDKQYDHGLKSFYIEPFSILLDIYNQRLDLQKTYPEVSSGDYSKIAGWAAKHGQNEYPILKKDKSLYDLLVVYYSRQDLQKTFPEVKDHNLKNLVDWAIKHGINEEAKLGDKNYFERYHQDILRK